MILTCNQKFKYNVLKDVRAFIDSVSNRTIDTVPSLNILTLQLYTWSKLEEDQKTVSFDEEKQKEYPPISPLTEEDFKVYSRLYAEETMRRGIKRDT